MKGRSRASPDHWEKDGTTADEIYQEQDLLPEPIVAGALLTGFNDNVCHISQDLWGWQGTRWHHLQHHGLPSSTPEHPSLYQSLAFLSESLPTCLHCLLSLPPCALIGSPHTLHTCRGITTPKIFFSLSDSTYFTKAQPEPIKATVMKRRAPFSLGDHSSSNDEVANQPSLLASPTCVQSWATHRCVI